MAIAAPTRPRPLSPHLGIWRWRSPMAASIFHRVTGNAMGFGAFALFAWWLLAAASGPKAYETWHHVARGPFGLIVGVGFTWTLFQHMASGLRHLVMDTGTNFEIHANRRSASLTFAFSILMTALVWALILAR